MFSPDGTLISASAAPHCGAGLAAEAARKRAAGTSVAELLDDPEVWTGYCHHARVVKRAAEDVRQSKILGELREVYAGAILRVWQADLLAKLDRPPHPRSITWYLDPAGASGQTWLSRYLLVMRPDHVILFENGRSQDLKYAYDGQRIVLLDLSRSQEDRFNYEVLESIKNGLMEALDLCSLIFFLT